MLGRGLTRIPAVYWDLSKYQPCKSRVLGRGYAVLNLGLSSGKALSDLEGRIASGAGRNRQMSSLPAVGPDMHHTCLCILYLVCLCEQFCLIANCYTWRNCSWLCLNLITCVCMWLLGLWWLDVDWVVWAWGCDWCVWCLVLYKVSDWFSIDLMNLCLEQDDHLYCVGNYFYVYGLVKYEKSNSYSIDLIEPMLGTSWSFIPLGNF